MNKFKYAFYTTLALALMAIPAMAQGAADNESSVAAAKAIGGGIGFGLAAGLAGIGQGLVGSRAAAIGAEHAHAVDLDAVQCRIHAADRHLRAFAEVAI